MPPPAKGVELEVVDGITEHSSRVALKGVFQMFGDVVACWVPPIDRRHVDRASIRFGNATAAEAAKQACDAGQVFLQGLPLKVDYRMGGGRRVGNSDLGESGNNNDQDKARAIMETAASERDRDRDRRHRRSRSRRGHDKRRERSRSRRRSRDRRRSRSRDRDRDRDRGRRGETKAEEKEKPAALPMPTPAPAALPPSQPAQPPAAIASPPPSFGAGKDASPPMSVAAAFPPLEASLPFELPAFDPEAEAKRKAELEKAKAERAKQLKRGPGVAALVQGALKRALTQPSVAKKEEEPERPPPVSKAPPEAEVGDDSEDEVKALLQRKEQELLEAKKQEQLQKEAKEREAAEKLAKEKREQALREAMEAERDLQKKEQETREQRIKASVEAAKRQQAERAAKEAGALYGDMPDPNLEPGAQQAASDAALQRELENKNMANASSSKVLFLDIDGVLRPARAGGFDISPGESDKGVDTSDFFPGAVKALRHIVERTAAKVVLTSEWRRSDPALKALSDKFAKEQVRIWSSVTATNLELEKSSDALKAFAERRAQEISLWLQEHEREVSGWVVVDDVNLALADASKKEKAKPMQPHLVQTWPLCGLTIGNAKTAVRILNGELINKVVVERPVAPVGSGSKK